MGIKYYLIKSLLLDLTLGHATTRGTLSLALGEQWVNVLSRHIYCSHNETSA